MATQHRLQTRRLYFTPQLILVPFLNTNCEKWFNGKLISVLHTQSAIIKELQLITSQNSDQQMLFIVVFLLCLRGDLWASLWFSLVTFFPEHRSLCQVSQEQGMLCTFIIKPRRMQDVCLLQLSIPLKFIINSPVQHPLTVGRKLLSSAEQFSEMVHILKPVVLSRKANTFAVLDHFKGTHGQQPLCFPFSLP